ncbi:MAG: carboxypeptidase regulatory-like domain-containing protein [Phycisphaerae bacterium]|nr:carboxypeptidase regulatory-like domain-containing protein [Phycisphaerae bacterium]
MPTPPHVRTRRASGGLAALVAIALLLTAPPGWAADETTITAEQIHKQLNLPAEKYSFGQWGQTGAASWFIYSIMLTPDEPPDQPLPPGTCFKINQNQDIYSIYDYEGMLIHIYQFDDVAAAKKAWELNIEPGYAVKENQDRLNESLNAISDFMAEAAHRIGKTSRTWVDVDKITEFRRKATERKLKDFDRSNFAFERVSTAGGKGGAYTVVNRGYLPQFRTTSFKRVERLLLEEARLKKQAAKRGAPHRYDDRRYFEVTEVFNTAHLGNMHGSLGEHYYVRVANCVVYVQFRNAHNLWVDENTVTWREKLPEHKQVMATLAKLHGGKLPVPEDELATELRVAAWAEGCNGQTRTFTQDDYAPSGVRVHGVVRDDAGEPVAGATVSLMGLDTQVTTGAAGRYSAGVALDAAAVSTPAGARLWTVRADFELPRRLKGLHARLTSPKPLIANARMQQATLHVTADGEPLAGRKIRISLPPRWTKDGREVDYIAHGPITRFNHEVTTGADGTATLSFPAPGPLGKKLGVMRERQHALYFPVHGSLVVRDLTTDQTCRTAYTLTTPWPRIKRFTLINVTAGNWQPKPGSQLEIIDPDSDTFRVEIKLAGRMKIPRNDVIYRRTLLTDLKGKRLVFFYEPPKWGMDLNKQPGDLWKEFGMFNLQLAGKLLVDKAGSAALKQTSILAGHAHLDKVYKGNVDCPPEVVQSFLDGRVEQAQKVLSGAKSAWGAVEAYDKAADAKFQLGKLAKQKTVTGADVEANVVNVYDNVVGVVSLSQRVSDWQPGAINAPSGVSRVAGRWGRKTLGSSRLNKLAGWANKATSSTVPLEVLKVTYENAKFMLKLHRQFEAVVNAQKDTLLVPVIAYITDSEGHRTVSVRSVAVGVWKKEP